MIGDILAMYLQEKAPHMAPDGIRTLGAAIKPLIEYWADKPASILRENTCRGYVAWRKTRTTAAPRQELAYLKAAVNHDWRAGRLIEPVPVWLPSPPQARQRWLTREEAAHLVWSARKGESKSYLPLFILLGIYTGARKQALLQLRWHQVDLQRRIIRLAADGEATTNKRKAIIPIPSRLMTVLRYARQRGTDFGYVIRPPENRRRVMTAQEKAAPLKDIKGSFQAACQRAGLEDVTPHTLRHTAASWMVQAGVPLFEVARYLGHTSTAMVEKTYGHMAPHHLKAAASALDNRKKSLLPQ
jgi:integrase